MTATVDAVRALADLPEVGESVDRAREACTELRWHNALRRRIPQAAAESRVRGAQASAALDGAEVSVDVVRELVVGLTSWPKEPDPLERALRGAVQATAETEHARDLVLTSPAQALARLHVAVAGHDKAPVAVVAALAHAEIATMRPFVRGNAIVARGFERALVQAAGLDPTGVCVPEVGHLREASAGYVGALAAYATGSADGVRLWLTFCVGSYERGAREGMRIADAVLAGRLGGS